MSKEKHLAIDPSDLPDESVIFGRTAPMQEIRGRLQMALENDVPVLIEGESGTGKEVIARFLHARSRRKHAPFVKINCAAIPASLLESELFGFERGAFTGANEARAGLVETAEGGSLFLDEIGSLHLSLQGKLLHLLQDGTYFRIGGQEEKKARIRVVCASNTDLRAAVHAGKFREDLFYRIEVLSLRLPALRDRKADIPQFCEYFIQKLARKFRRTPPQLSERMMNLLAEWNWPGNIRELENWIARATILGDDAALGAELTRQVAGMSASPKRESAWSSFKQASREAASAASTAVILRVLETNHGNRRKTAIDLNMSYRSLLYKLREVGIPQRRRSHSALRRLRD